MGLSVMVQRDAEWLTITAAGPATLSDFKGFADLIARICQDEHRDTVLVDLREVEQSLSFTEHLQMGAYIAQRLAFLSRMATVVPPVARSGNSERAAQKSGLQLRTFTDMDEALGWLRA